MTCCMDSPLKFMLGPAKVHRGHVLGVTPRLVPLRRPLSRPVSHFRLRSEAQQPYPLPTRF